MCGDGEPALTAWAHSDSVGCPQQPLQLHFLPEFWATQCTRLTTSLVSPSPSLPIPTVVVRVGGVGRRELLWAASGICSQPGALPLLQASL